MTYKRAMTIRKSPTNFVVPLKQCSVITSARTIRCRLLLGDEPTVLQSGLPAPKIFTVRSKRGAHQRPLGNRLVMKIVASALSDRGLKRDGNEDQYLIDESLGLYVVCDGMGGHAAGEVAAERAIELSVGGCFGEATLIAPAKSPLSLIANEPARVLIVDRKKFNRLTRRMPRMGNALLHNLSRHLSERIVAAEASRPINLDDT